MTYPWAIKLLSSQTIHQSPPDGTKTQTILDESHLPISTMRSASEIALVWPARIKCHLLHSNMAMENTISTTKLGLLFAHVSIVRFLNTTCCHMPSGKPTIYVVPQLPAFARLDQTPAISSMAKWKCPN